MTRLDVHIAGNRVTLRGRIDDAAELGALAGRLPAGDLAIDTAGVTFINSVGMREWLRLVRALRERGQRVRLEGVADLVMAQLNLIAELRGALTIASFHAPYECAACGAEHAPLIDAIAHAELLRRMSAPAVACPECGAPSQLADFPERYLSIFTS
ncbi:MAG TPA: STAS domain-containing protein [Kofleriaceae bacterium]|nr:STAS domain-containing protein [Kofleriaceae bacterium]